MNMRNAAKGNHFILTKYGYKKTLKSVRKGRKIGKPVKLFEYRCPISWIEKGYVVEVEEN